MHQKFLFLCLQFAKSFANLGESHLKQPWQEKRLLDLQNIMQTQRWLRQCHPLTESRKS